MMSWFAGPAAAYGPYIPPTFKPRPDRRRLAGPAPSLEACLREAQLSLREGDPWRALGWFDLALSVRPRFGLALLGRAASLSALGRHDEAEQSMATALDGDHDDGAVPLHLARLAALEGERALAMDLLNVALVNEPKLQQAALEDPAFRGLRDHPRFCVMVGAL